MIFLFLIEIKYYFFFFNEIFLVFKYFKYHCKYLYLNNNFHIYLINNNNKKYANSQITFSKFKKIQIFKKIQKNF